MAEFDLLKVWSLVPAWLVLIFAAMTVGVAGWKMARHADALADWTGMGEAIMGAVFLGAATSLPGIITSAAAGLDGYPDLALSNALGGIATQTLFLAFGDLAYREANLEHAAASIQNLLQATLLLTLLGVVLMAAYTPNLTVWQIHPATPLLVVAYLAGLRMIHRARDDPMWSPKKTKETRMDLPVVKPEGNSLIMLWVRFGLLALVVGVAGLLIERAAVVIVENSEISETVIGGLLTATVTSLPELVTTISAVRGGALTLAVGGIIGGNAFDMLFAGIADVFYREGSLYHAASDDTLFLLSLAIVLTGVLLMGLIRREKLGPGRVGFESILIFGIYVSGVALLFYG